MLCYFKNKINPFLLVIMLLLMTCVFKTNLFNFAEVDFFNAFQKDSEALVLGKIVADKQSLSTQKAHLGSSLASSAGASSPLDAYHILQQQESGQTATATEFVPYLSQFGLQGIIFSRLSYIFGLKLSSLQWIVSFLMSFTLCALFYLYRRIYDTAFANIFLVVSATSPWVISMASNLYWIPFLWFIPAILAACLYLHQQHKMAWVYYVAIFFAVWIKSLTGYEYLSSITIMTCSVFLIAPWFEKKISPTQHQQLVKKNIKIALWVFGLCVLGFLCALLMHANLRGDGVWDGLIHIFKEDVQRRTFGNPNDFPDAYRESLQAPLSAVLKKYFLLWYTPIFLWLSPKIFALLFFVALLIPVFEYKKTKHRHYLIKQYTLLTVFVAAPLSWLVLAKGHSYIHTHINFILWYLGAIPAMYM